MDSDIAAGIVWIPWVGGSVQFELEVEHAEELELEQSMTEGFKVEESTVSKLAKSLTPFVAAIWEVILSENWQENVGVTKFFGKSLPRVF